VKIREGQVTECQVRKWAGGLPGQPEVDVPLQGCKDDTKKSADSRLAVVFEVNNDISPRDNPENVESKPRG